ncbi:MAG: diaminopimelate decarboxylase family protein, partial [Egibacteraceae bacterium]
MIPPFPRTARFDGPRLAAVGGVDVADLAGEYGTPLYVMDHAELVARMRTYRTAFGDGVTVTYGAKALCVVGVLQLVAAEGLGLDVASAGELRTAERAGFPMDRVVLHGNNKAVAELAAAVDLGVGRVVADSLAELQRLSQLAVRSDREVAVALRITPGIAAHTHASIATGHDEAKFGFAVTEGLADQAVA